jgi:hypothetical protein
LPLLFVLFFAPILFAQQPTTTGPIYEMNAHYLMGRTWADYQASAGTGLALNVAPGTAACGAVVVTYAGGTLTMTNAATNYVYLDPNASCIPAKNTTGFVRGQVPLAKVVTSGGAITTVTDVRGWFTTAAVQPEVYATDYAGSDIGAKIQAAHDALPAAGGKIVVPVIGLTDWTTAVTITKAITLAGLGRNITQLQINAAITPLTFAAGSDYADVYGLNISRKGGFSGTIPNIIVSTSDGARFHDLTLYGANTAGLDLDNFTDVSVDSVILTGYAAQVGTGIKTHGTSYTSTTLNVSRSTFRSWDHAIELNNTVDFTATANIFEGNNRAIYAGTGNVWGGGMTGNHAESDGVASTYFLELTTSAQAAMLVGLNYLSGSPVTDYILYSGSATAAQVLAFGFAQGPSSAVLPVNFKGAVSIGGGANITKHLTSQYVFDFGTVAANACFDTAEQTLTGAADGDTVAVGVPSADASVAGLVYTAFVSSAGKIKVRVCNVATSTSADPASGTYRVDVWQH